MSPGHHSKDPNISQYLNYVTSYACLQGTGFLMAKFREASTKTKALSAKTKTVMGHPVEKDPVQKDQVQQKSN